MENKRRKPAPLMVGDRPHYTLSSCEPVTVELVVPQVTEADVALALASLVAQAGGSEGSLQDAAWLEAHFGTSDLARIREGVRSQVTDANYDLLDQQRQDACMDALSERLEHSVPADQVAEVRQQVQMNFEAQVQAAGLGLDQFLAQMGTTRLGLDATLNEQAQKLAEQDAALGAFAEARGLRVAEEDYPRLLRLPASRTQALVDRAKAAGQADAVRESALRNRALELVVAECVCTYRHETDEEAAARANA